MVEEIVPVQVQLSIIQSIFHMQKFHVNLIHVIGVLCGLMHIQIVPFKKRKDAHPNWEMMLVGIYHRFPV